MTIRVRAAQKRVNKEQITALLTQSLLSDNIDDAPSSKKAGDGWLMWSAGLERVGPQID